MKKKNKKENIVTVIMSGIFWISLAAVGMQLCKSTSNDLCKEGISIGKKMINSWKNK